MAKSSKQQKAKTDPLIKEAVSSLPEKNKVALRSMLKLSKSEFIDLLLEEVLTQLNTKKSETYNRIFATEKALAKDLSASARKCFEQEFSKNREFSQIENIQDDCELRVCNRASPEETRGMFRETTRFRAIITAQFKLESGQTLNLSHEVDFFRSELAEDLLSELYDWQEYAKELSLREREIQGNVVKFKNQVVKVLLNQESEGAELLTKIKTLANKLINLEE